MSERDFGPKSLTDAHDRTLRLLDAIDARLDRIEKLLPPPGRQAAEELSG